MSRNSYNNPDFKPFQSGNSLCHPSKDYAAFKGGKKGGSNTLIKTTPGKNLFKMPNFKVSKDNLNTLSGKSYSTSAGGSKKNKKGGVAPVGEEQSGGKKRVMKKVMKKKGGNVFKSTPSPLKGGKKRVMKKGGNIFKSTPSPLKDGKKRVMKKKRW